MGRRWLQVMVVVAMPLAALGCQSSCRQPVKSTQLEITIIGGFAFVPTLADRRLEIAYLNDWALRTDTDKDGIMEAGEPPIYVDRNKNGVQDSDEPDTCNVDQIGTEFKITRGSISVSEPTNLTVPAAREFDLDKAIVTFPALEAANLPLTINRGTWPPSPNMPPNPDDEAHWKDMVPSLKDYHAGSTINPNWRNMVNGRVSLRGGTIKAAVPSSPILKRAHFDFRNPGGQQFKAATTDKLIYTVDVPAGEVEILLNPPAMGFSRIVIQPQGNRVELTLRGKHGSSAQPAPGMPLHDFCAFYQLLQPMPPPEQFLLPHYVPAPPLPGNNQAAMPSPGWFCPGDWF